MPSWLAAVITYAVGTVSGVVIAFASTTFNAWYQERRDRRSRGRQLLARVHSVVEDAQPDPMLFSASLDQERAERTGAELWQRWREVSEPLRIYAFESSEPIQRAAKQTATHVSLSIQATRNAIAAAHAAEAMDTRRTAQQVYSVANDCLADFDRVFADTS